MRAIFIWYLLIIGTISVTARSRRGFRNKHKTAYYRSMDDFTTEDEEPKISRNKHKTAYYRSMDDFTTEDEEPKISTNTKLIVIKARSNDANEGRFFKHILLYKNLIQPDHNHGGGGGGGGGGYTFPYIIINNPTNLTNINNNTLTNTPAAPTGTATGGTGTGGGARVPYRYLSNSQALPYAIPMNLPTQVYQQRQQFVPQVVYGPPPPINTGNQNIRRRNRNKNKNKRPSNPFSNFANSFKRIQFF